MPVNVSVVASKSTRGVPYSRSIASATRVVKLHVVSKLGVVMNLGHGSSRAVSSARTYQRECSFNTISVVASMQLGRTRRFLPRNFTGPGCCLVFSVESRLPKF